MTINELLNECKRLEQIASNIQKDKPMEGLRGVKERFPGLSTSEIRSFVSDYRQWYTSALQFIPKDLVKEFRKYYEEKILLFITDPVKQIYSDRAQQDVWYYPFEDFFKNPFIEQATILLEASKRPELVTLHVKKPIEILENLAKRFHPFALQLLERRRNKGEPRPTIIITDEYDFQDLFHAVLTLHFDDIRPEEWMPSYAGVSPRTDFLLKTEQIFVELKKTRTSLTQAEVRDQIIVDKEHYQAHPDCKSLVAIIYDPDRRIKNPKGFERDLSKPINGMSVKVIVIQN